MVAAVADQMTDTLHLRLSADLKAQLIAEAAQRGMTPAQLVRLALQHECGIRGRARAKVKR